MAVIARFKIGRDVGGTSAVPPEAGVKHAESATVGARTLGVHELQIVLGTAEVAVVATDAPAEPHASVERRLHNDDVFVGARSAEHVRLTELLYLSCVTHTHTYAYYSCQHLAQPSLTPSYPSPSFFSDRPLTDRFCEVAPLEMEACRSYIRAFADRRGYLIMSLSRITTWPT